MCRWHVEEELDPLVVIDALISTGVAGLGDKVARGNTR
jgi:hypothetical protein